MRKATREWVKKAEFDCRVAVGLESGSIPSADQICFLCQQASEKYVKALLEEAGLSIPKTHDLLVLMGLTQSHHPNIVVLRRGLSVLTRYGVAPRYPGFSACRDCLLLLFHPLEAGQQQRLGVGVLLLAQERAAEQRLRVERRPDVGLFLLADGQVLAEEGFRLGAVLGLEQPQAERLCAILVATCALPLDVLRSGRFLP